MTQQPDHEFEVLEDDQNVPPRPEEKIADAPTAMPAEPTGPVVDDRETPVSGSGRPRAPVDGTEPSGIR